ncbi:hypothetical protein [Persephonella sp.]
MKTFFLIFLFTFSFLHADQICDDLDDLVVECYHKRVKGDLKSCNITDFKVPELNEACKMGCLSESLYEANLNGEILKNECRKKD